MSDPEQGRRPLIPALLAGVLAGSLVLIPRALVILAPAPLLLVHRRWGARWGLQATATGALIAFVASTAGATTVAPSSVLLGYLLFAALPAALLAWGLQRTKNPARGLAIATGAWLALVAGMVLIRVSGAVEPLVAGLAAEVGSALDQVVAGARARADERGVALGPWEELERRRESLVEWITRLSPSLVVAAGLLGMWINLVYVRWFAGRPQVEEGDLCGFSLPFGQIWVVMVAMGALALQLLLGPGSALWSELLVGLAGNVLVVSMVLYWLQGVAVLNFFYLRLPLGPMSRALGLGVQVVAMATPVVSIGYLVAGLGDAWLDLRRRPWNDEAENRNGAER